jgi:hypothetical protein
MRAYQTRRVGTLGIVAATFLIWIPAVWGAEAHVDWINRANVSVSGDRLQKTAGCDGCDDAGAVSRQRIWRGDGYVEFAPSHKNHFWVAGLSHDDGGTSFEDIDLAFRFNGAGHADVMESGVYQNGSDTDYAVGDVFRVAVIGGTVRYFKNSQLVYESRRAPDYPLLLDTALGSAGTTVLRATIAGAGEPELLDEDEGGVAFSRFDALDTNNDGRIEWDEWPGSWERFDAQDFDRNGVLTWGELAPPPGGGETPVAVTIDVDPRQRWSDTGVWLSSGDVVTLDAMGVVQLSTNRNDIAWPAGSRSGRRAAEGPLRGQRAGALIARVGNSAPIFVGGQRSIVAPATGLLYLGVNDDYVADNTGAFQVEVLVQRRY